MSTEPRTQIIFVSYRDNGKREIYVIRADRKQQRSLTNNRHRDIDPTWFVPTFAGAPVGKQFTIWS